MTGSPTAEATGVGLPSASPEGEQVPAAQRGGTRIADRVVAKVASQAAKEALRSGSGTRFVPAGRRYAPRASVSVQEDKARVRITVDLGYPSDIGALCAAVRRQVAQRVGELVGMEAREVAVQVERLHSRYLDGEALGRVR